jgi:predicted SprT family Zn-dependent metalloprotease
MRQATRKALKTCNLDLFAADPEEVFLDRIRSGRFFPNEDDLEQLYACLNMKYFSGALPEVKIEWSMRMKHAGKCIVSHKIIKLGTAYHRHYPEDITDTLKHEMIHLKIVNHGPAFNREAARIGTTRYAKDYPGMLRGLKYLYECPSCGETFASRKRFRERSCGRCSKGKYDPRFKLRFIKRIDNGERL